MRKLDQESRQAKGVLVCAVVVTFNRKSLLQRCIESLLNQTRPVDEILVIDNASTDGTSEMLVEKFPKVSVLRLETNEGGAGGFHVGVQEAHRRGFDWLWLMDDDGVPAGDCLEQLLEARGDRAVLVPVQQDSDGRLYGIGVWRGVDISATREIVAGDAPLEGKYIFAFVGPLISKRAVDEIGLPNRDFFIWYDDIEYSLRIAAHRDLKIAAVPTALFFHDYGGASRVVTFLGRKSVRTTQPAWKTYYAARNPLFIATRVHANLKDLATYAGYQLRYAFGELIYEPDRWTRLGLRFRGVLDGATGKMGKRVSP